eukprot:scaffold35931_cov21-Tisochrysis_lutea.AAC.2
MEPDDLCNACTRSRACERKRAELAAKQSKGPTATNNAKAAQEERATKLAQTKADKAAQLEAARAEKAAKAEEAKAEAAARAEAAKAEKAAKAEAAKAEKAAKAEAKAKGEAPAPPP